MFVVVHHIMHVLTLQHQGCVTTLGGMPTPFMCSARIENVGLGSTNSVENKMLWLCSCQECYIACFAVQNCHTPNVHSTNIM